MSLSMYQASIPVYMNLLSALSKIIEKAAAHAEAKKITPEALLHARLFPDMFTFTRQVQIATDHAKGAPARLAGVEVPAFPDTEASFSELQARIQKTIDFLKTFSPEQINGSEEKEIILTIGPNKIPLKGQDYLLHFSMPNFYFHLTTAYDILRHNGVELGKRDFMGR
jgi:hypothetical protein